MSRPNPTATPLPAGWFDPWPDPPPPEPEPDPANSRVQVWAVQCARCRSKRVHKRDWERGATVIYWQCRDCYYRWKEPAGVGDQRAAIV